MTSGRPGKDDNLWRDLAATVVQQVADRVRRINESAQSGHRDPKPPAEPDSTGWYSSGSSRFDGHKSRGHDSSYGHDGPSRRSAQSPLSGPMASLGGELKKLMSEGLKATAAQAGEFKQTLETANVERERRRREAPMRKAQHRSRANKAGAVGFGVLALGTLGGTASLAVQNEVPAAVPGGVLTVGLSAGAVVLNRRGSRYSRLADEEARRLGAASAEAISLRGASAYTVPLPPQSSMAYEPTRRLVAQKSSLAELLPDIEQIAPELGPLAQESESTLAQYAERIIKLERAQAAASGTSSLDAALARAVAQYEEGVDAHQKLVEAAATVMAELSSTGIGDPAHHSIDAAADRLQGLAEGLRQVRHDIPVSDPASAWPAPPARPEADASHPAPRPASRRRGKPNRQRGLAD